MTHIPLKSHKPINREPPNSTFNQMKMDTISSSILTPKLPLNPTRYPIRPNCRLHLPNNPITARSALKMDGSGYGWDYGGGLVDENMLVLRKRIQELQVAETEDPDSREGWMEWEHNYFESCYGSDVCQAVGLVQLFAMSMRPSMALGLVGIMSLSVPISVVMVGIHLGEALRSLAN